MNICHCFCDIKGRKLLYSYFRLDVHLSAHIILINQHHDQLLVQLCHLNIWLNSYWCLTVDVVPCCSIIYFLVRITYYRSDHWYPCKHSYSMIITCICFSNVQSINMGSVCVNVTFGGVKKQADINFGHLIAQAISMDVFTLGTRILDRRRCADEWNCSVEEDWRGQITWSQANRSKTKANDSDETRTRDRLRVKQAW